MSSLHPSLNAWYRVAPQPALRPSATCSSGRLPARAPTSDLVHRGERDGAGRRGPQRPRGAATFLWHRPGGALGKLASQRLQARRRLLRAVLVDPAHGAQELP
eukprot:10506863-Alexandrium_andersonii.AAC.1